MGLKSHLYFVMYRHMWKCYSEKYYILIFYQDFQESDRNFKQKLCVVLLDIMQTPPYLYVWYEVAKSSGSVIHLSCQSVDNKALEWIIFSINQIQANALVMDYCLQNQSATLYTVCVSKSSHL